MAESKTKKKVPFFVVILIWLFAIAALLSVMAISICFYAAAPATDESSEAVYELHIPKGMSTKDVAQELQDNGIIKSWSFFYIAARFNVFDKIKSTNQTFSLKSGVYTVKSSMNLNELYELLQTGAAANIKISIPEGLTISKTAAELEKANICLAKDFIQACNDTKILEKYNIPEGKNLEGYLFPDTYFFTEGMSIESIVDKFLENFFNKLSEIEELKGLSPEDFYQTLVLASIIEREYRVPSEAPVIASVFTNRIKHNIGLYSCATIEYILTEIQGLPHPDRITYDDLKIDSPYNTYKWAALPPGPISNPGLIALKAAAKPAETDYFYFVLTDPATGSHTFSKSFDQHIKAENLYTKKLPAKK